MPCKYYFAGLLKKNNNMIIHGVIRYQVVLYLFNYYIYVYINASSRNGNIRQ